MVFGNGYWQADMSIQRELQTALQVISARAYLVTTWGRNLLLPVTILAALNRVTKDPLQIT
jgi:hypothetical protein